MPFVVSFEQWSLVAFSILNSGPVVAFKNMYFGFLPCFSLYPVHPCFYSFEIESVVKGGDLLFGNLVPLRLGGLPLASRLVLYSEG